MLIRFSESPFTNLISWRHEIPVWFIDPFLRILPFTPLLNITCPAWHSLNFVKTATFPIMCQEHPLSKYQSEPFMAYTDVSATLQLFPFCFDLHSVLTLFHALFLKSVLKWSGKPCRWKQNEWICPSFLQKWHIQHFFLSLCICWSFLISAEESNLSDAFTNTLVEVLVWHPFGNPSLVLFYGDLP